MIDRLIASLIAWLKVCRTQKIGQFTIGRIYLSEGHSGSWMLYINLGPGYGYRWIDLPGYRNSIYAPWYRHLSISGRTMKIGRKVADKRPDGYGSKIRPWYVTGFSTRCNVPVYPQWY